MINAKLGNAWQARCSFCGATPKDLRDGIDLMTEIDTLKDLHSSPLHVLLRVGDGFFKAGFRLQAEIFKYDVPLSEEEHTLINWRYFEHFVQLKGNKWERFRCFIPYLRCFITKINNMK